MISSEPRIRDDEFFGLTHADAAKRYIKKVGHAVSFEELADAMKKGGSRLTGVDPKKILFISLIRNTRDFVPPQPGSVGRPFYLLHSPLAQNRIRAAPQTPVEAEQNLACF